MSSHADKAQENKSTSVAETPTKKKAGGETDALFVNNHPEAIVQRKLQNIANNSSQVKQLHSVQKMANEHSARLPQPVVGKENRKDLETAASAMVQKPTGNIPSQSAPIQRKLDTSQVEDAEVLGSLTMAKSLGVFQDVAVNEGIQVVIVLNTEDEPNSYADTRLVRAGVPIVYEITLYKKACTVQGAFRTGIATYALQHEMDLHVLRSDDEGNRSAANDRRHPNTKDPAEHRKLITPWNVTISEEDFSIKRTGGTYAQRVVEQLQEGVKLSSDYADLYAYIISYCNDVRNVIGGMKENMENEEAVPNPGFERNLRKEDVENATNLLGEVHNALITACAEKETTTEGTAKEKLRAFRQRAAAKFIETRETIVKISTS
ncbi:MAG: hypothetical protein K0S33_2865 [Bacteroidetes bacterium]|jgi:hypothetical protein|nr:hypothetical protein [Bacteroidota bacterium]